VALRPAWVLDPGMYRRIGAQRQADPGSEWTPTWEYGQFVDVRDVADAVHRAVDVPLAGHHRMLLCAADIAATEPSLVMAARFAPSVPVRDTARFQHDPWRALFDCSAAARVLGWHPRHTWSTHGHER
jgi:UDP-glucose 4-epimerase